MLKNIVIYSVVFTRFLTMSSKQIYFNFGEKIIYKQAIPQDKKPWNVSWADYAPTNFEIDFNRKPWADPEINDPNFHPKFNQLDGNVDRQSYEGVYSVIDGYPLNPKGRTGIRLRGRLGRWGPNKAADPIVSRWKRHDGSNEIVKNSLTNLPILQFVGIQRRDTGDWAIPGGMVDPGENVTVTLKREFFEEALNGLELDQAKRTEMEGKLECFFKSGVEIYRGYVDDPRNSDNAWMETIAYNFHDETGRVIGSVNLEAGDDASHVKWIDIDKSLNLYASHAQFISKVAHKLGAHW